MLRQDEAFTVLAVTPAQTGLRKLGETVSGNPLGVALSNSSQLAALGISPVGLAVGARMSEHNPPRINYAFVLWRPRSVRSVDLE